MNVAIEMAKHALMIGAFDFVMTLAPAFHSMRHACVGVPKPRHVCPGARLRGPQGRSVWDRA